MKNVKLILLTAFLLCRIVSAIGQTKLLPIKFYKEKVNLVLADSQFERVVIANERFGKLTGYLKNDSFVLITEIFYESYGFKETNRLFNNDPLVFANTRERTFTGWPENKDSTLFTSYDAVYIFSRNRIVKKMVTGEQKLEVQLLMGDPVLHT